MDQSQYSLKKKRPLSEIPKILEKAILSLNKQSRKNTTKTNEEQTQN